MYYRRGIETYLSIGYLLHIMTIAELMLIFLAGYFMGMKGSFVYLPFSIRVIVLSMFMGYPVFAQLDAYSRFQNYRQLKDQFYFNGFQERILRPVLRSRCQRDAALVAANELGLGKECRKYFRLKGYKWYNLLPDFFFTRPDFIFTKFFWRTTFFTRKYHSKVNYKVIHSRRNLFSWNKYGDRTRPDNIHQEPIQII